MNASDPLMVKFSELVVDPRVQSRCEIDEAYCKELADTYEWEKDPDLPVVFRDHSSGRKVLILASGFQRRHALQDLRREKAMWCQSRDGTLRDAVLFSVGCNDTPLRPRTRADKEHAVGMLLDDPEWAKWSDSEIARRCKVDRGIVVFVKAERKKKAADEARKAREKAAQEMARKVGVAPPPPEKISLADSASEGEGKKEKVTYRNRWGGTSQMDTSRIGGPREPRGPRCVPDSELVKDLLRRAKGHARKLQRDCESLAKHLGKTAEELFALYGDWAAKVEEAARKKLAASTVGEPF